MPNEAQRNLIFRNIGYIPSAEQKLVHDSAARVKLIAGGERGGKSKCSAMELSWRFPFGKLYWLVAADYERTRPEFDYMCDTLDKLGWDYEASKQVDPGEILAEGGFRFVTKSAKDPRKLAAEAPDGILVCEASQITYEDYLRLRGRIAEKRGWMLMSGTFESSLGWYPEMFTRGLAQTMDFASFSLPSWSNRVVYPGGRSDPEILALEAASSPEWFMERYGGVPCPPKGVVFPEFKINIHCGNSPQFDFDPGLAVEIWVDPGYAHFYSVLAVQKRGDQIFVFDEIYEHGLTTEDMVVVAQKKPWWNKVVGGAIDIAGTQHQAMSAPAEVWLKEGRVHLQSKHIRIQDGIERVKTMLKVNPLTGQPNLFVNLKCQGLISEFGGCPNPKDGQTRVYKWKQDREGNVIGGVPDDKNNDAIKALTYGVIDMMGYSLAQNRAAVKFM